MPTVPTELPGALHTEFALSLILTYSNATVDTTHTYIHKDVYKPSESCAETPLPGFLSSEHSGTLEIMTPSVRLLNELNWVYSITGTSRTSPGF